MRATSVAPAAPHVSPARRTRHSPRRGTSRPARSAITAVAAVIGSRAKPVSSASKPRRRSRPTARQKMAPVETEVEQEADRDRRRERRVAEDRRVDQWAADHSLEQRECRRGKASGDDERERQPRSPAVRAGIDEPAVRAARQNIARTCPGTSNDRRRLGVSSACRRRSHPATRPIGTFAKKIARQPIDVTRMPPRTGPLARPIPDTAPQTASARRRACGSANVCAIKASEQAINHAAPTPCATRAAIRKRNGVRDRARCACHDEDGEPDDEASANPDSVGQRTGEQKQRRECDGVSIDDPLRDRGRTTEVGPDRTEGNVHDRRVERDHQEARRDRNQRQPLTRRTPASIATLAKSAWQAPL